MPIRTLVFGEGTGQIGGDHKNTFINQGAVASTNGGSGTITIREGAGNDVVALVRFSLVGHIPANATVITSTLSLYLNVAPAGNSSTEIRALITDWGVTPTDEGATEDPATGGQATFRRSFDFNGAGGDVTWVGGNYGVGVDSPTTETTFTVNAADPAGTLYQAQIPLMTQAWVQDDATNYGFAIRTATAGLYRFDSQESATVAERPSLAVTYSIPSVRRQSTLGVSVGLSV